MKSVFHNDPCFCNYTALPFVMSKHHLKIEFDRVKKNEGESRSVDQSGDLGFLLTYGCVQEKW